MERWKAADAEEAQLLLRHTELGVTWRRPSWCKTRKAEIKRLMFSSDVEAAIDRPMPKQRRHCLLFMLCNAGWFQSQMDVPGRHREGESLVVDAKCRIISERNAIDADEMTSSKREEMSSDQWKRKLLSLIACKGKWMRSDLPCSTQNGGHDEQLVASSSWCDDHLAIPLPYWKVEEKIMN